MIAIISVENTDDFFNKLNNFHMSNGFIDVMAQHPKLFLIALIVFFILLLISCIMAIVGSLAFIHQLLYAFVALDFFYVLFLIVFDVFLMLNFKAKNTDLGMLIMYGNMGLFILRKIYYQYFIYLMIILNDFSVFCVCLGYGLEPFANFEGNAKRGAKNHHKHFSQTPFACGQWPVRHKRRRSLATTKVN